MIHLITKLYAYKPRTQAYLLITQRNSGYPWQDLLSCFQATLLHKKLDQIK